MREIILVQLSGQESQALTSTFFGVLAQYSVNVLDIGQAVIHNALNLGVLVEFPEQGGSESILAELARLVGDQGGEVRFSVVSDPEYQQWVADQCENRYVVTLLAKQITAEHVARVTQLMNDASLEIFNVQRLSERTILDPQGDQRVQNGRRCNACVEFSVRGPSSEANIAPLRAQFLQTSTQLGVDIAFQKDDAFRRNRRLVVFDMDSTLIETEVIDELAERAGVGAQVREITERAMLGEIDFKDSFTQRVALLKGLDSAVLEDVAETLPLTDGAERLMRVLKVLGYKTALVSGGFKYFGNRLKQRLGIDYVFANELEIADGKVTGRVVGDVVDADRKADLLKEIARRENISLQQVIAVGDGANDLKMLAVAGLGIAFRAKPIVKESAEQSISTVGLDGILYLIGVRDVDHLDLLG